MTPQDEERKPARKPKQHPTFDYSLCIACTICATACPVSAIELTRTDEDNLNTPYPQLGSRACIGCGTCEKDCPMRAIAMRAPETVVAP